jgi:hypothetical protein
MFYKGRYSGRGIHLVTLFPVKPTFQRIRYGPDRINDAAAQGDWLEIDQAMKAKDFAILDRQGR